MLRLVEHYVSVQGEGPNVGRLTQFVRFAGCNMRCPGWPCDTQHAIDPKIWVHNHEKVSSLDLVDRVLNSIRDTGANNICLTGGEPFLQSNKDFEDFVFDLNEHERVTIEVFTNGSFEFPSWALNCMTFMMDWKLGGSGERSTNIDTRRMNALNLNYGNGIKFVIADPADLEEALAVAKSLEKEGYGGEFWIGSAWDKIPEAALVEFMKQHKLDWRLNVQLHKYIWPADTQGV